MSHSPTNPQPQLPPDNRPQLPDYRPRGLSKINQVMLWVVGLVILFWTLGTFGHLATGTHPAANPTPRPTSTASAKAASNAPSIYVVVNSANGYLWWLDPNGSPFTYSSAKQFTKGHSTWHVYVLKQE